MKTTFGGIAAVALSLLVAPAWGQGAASVEDLVKDLRAR